MVTELCRNMSALPSIANHVNAFLIAKTRHSHDRDAYVDVPNSTGQTSFS